MLSTRLYSSINPPLFFYQPPLFFYQPASILLSATSALLRSALPTTPNARTVVCDVCNVCVRVVARVSCRPSKPMMVMMMAAASETARHETHYESKWPNTAQHRPTPGFEMCFAIGSRRPQPKHVSNPDSVIKNVNPHLIYDTHTHCFLQACRLGCLAPPSPTTTHTHPKSSPSTVRDL